jgi:hypothetical protein
MGLNWTCFTTTEDIKSNVAAELWQTPKKKHCAGASNNGNNEVCVQAGERVLL